MKTIIALTDLSANAKHATEYAYDMACQLKTNLVLCNAFMVSGVLIETGMVAVPVDEYSILNEDTQLELEALKQHLEKRGANKDFKPDINKFSQYSDIVGAIKDIALSYNIALIIAATHHKDTLNDILVGNNVNEMINNVGYPLLLVPPKVTFKSIRTVLFGTDLSQPQIDSRILNRLIAMIGHMQPRILVTHICKEYKPAYETELKDLLTHMVENNRYSNTGYKLFIEQNTNSGLDNACKNSEADMLVLVHHEHSWLQRIFSKSNSQKIAAQINIPLLIMTDKI